MEFTLDSTPRAMLQISYDLFYGDARVTSRAPKKKTQPPYKTVNTRAKLTPGSDLPFKPPTGSIPDRDQVSRFFSRQIE
ncbi:hypothetical protein YC2023_076639 [Brassica napus]